MARSSPLHGKPARQLGRFPDLGTAAYLGLHFTGFVASTFVLSWGLFALAFLALGGFSLDGLMHQLNNVTRRYVEAGPERIEQFRTAVAVVHLALIVVLIILRRHKMFPALAPSEDPDHGCSE